MNEQIKILNSISEYVPDVAQAELDMIKSAIDEEIAEGRLPKTIKVELEDG